VDYFLSDFAFRKLCGNLVEFHLLIKLYYSYCNEGNIWILGSYNLCKRKQLTAVNIVAFNSNCRKYLFHKEPCHL
jgi:hypothetical protein